MARLSIKKYFPQVVKSFVYSNYFTPAVTARLAIADAFGYSTDEKESGWLKYVSQGENNPTRYRAYSVLSYPYFMIGLMRSSIMKGIDWLAMGRKMGNEMKTPPIALAAKLLIGVPLMIVEVGCYFLSKIMDIPGMLYATVKKWKKDKSQEQFIKMKSFSTATIEKEISTLTHGVHGGHMDNGIKKTKIPASVAHNPVFHVNNNAQDNMPVYQDEKNKKPANISIINFHHDEDESDTESDAEGESPRNKK